MKHASLYLLLSLATIALLLLSGCQETPIKKNGKKENIVYINNDNDDGYVAIGSDFWGVVSSENNKQLIVGLFNTSDFSPDGEKLTFNSRSIFRFNISEWNNDNNITIHIKCINIKGDPGPLEVFLTDDPGPLPDHSELQDVMPIWNLIESSSRGITEVIPYENEWLNVTIPKDILKEMVSRWNLNLEQDHMTIMLTVPYCECEEETDCDEEYYGFASVDYTPTDESDQPYLIYK